MAHNRRHTYCPMCESNLDVMEQIVRDLQDVSTIIGAGGMATLQGLAGRDHVTPSMIASGRSARDLIDRMAEIRAGKSVSKRKRKTPKQAAYSRAFKKLAPKYKKKSGGWKKNGFKNCASAARKEAKRNGKKK